MWCIMTGDGFLRTKDLFPLALLTKQKTLEYIEDIGGYKGCVHMFPVMVVNPDRPCLAKNCAIDHSSKGRRKYLKKVFKK